MAPGGTPEDDLAPVSVARVRSARRAVAIALLAVSTALGLAVPSASTQDDDRLEPVSGPTSIFPSAPRSRVVPSSTSTSIAEALASFLPPVIARSSSRDVTPWSDDPTEPTQLTRSSVSSGLVSPPSVDPTRAGPGRTTGTTVGSTGTTVSSPRSADRFTTTTAGPGTTTTIDGTTTTTGGTTTTSQPGTTTTTGGTTTTTQPGTTTTTGGTTTTSQPGTTTTTQPFICPQGLVYGGILRDQEPFVFDGQSNNLAPIHDLSYPVQLMRLEWPDAPYAITAVGGTSFEQRIGWAAERTDPWVEKLGRPCAVLFDEGGPTDLANDASAEEVLDRNRRYIAARRAAGFDIIIGSTVPALDWLAPWQEAERVKYNALLRQRATAIGLDGLVDVAAIPDLQDPTDTRYFYDGAHFTTDAAMLVAQLFADVIPSW